MTRPVPADPQPNKAIVSAVGTVVLVGVRWAISGHLNLTDEGVVGLAGALTSLAVYAVSNWRRLLPDRAPSRSEIKRKAAHVDSGRRRS